MLARFHCTIESQRETSHLFDEKSSIPSVSCSNINLHALPLEVPLMNPTNLPARRNTSTLALVYQRSYLHLSYSKYLTNRLYIILNAVLLAAVSHALNLLLADLAILFYIDLANSNRHSNRSTAYHLQSTPLLSFPPWISQFT